MLFCCLSLSILILLSACSSPIGVERVSADIVHEELTTNVLTANRLSEASMNVLGQYNLLEEFN